MQLLSKQTRIDFLGKRKSALVISTILILMSIISFFVRGLSFGIDFTGGTLVEVGYSQAVSVEDVRMALEAGNINDAVVQYFGTSRDIMVRLPATYSSGNINSAEISSVVMEALRSPYNEILVESSNQSNQQCTTSGSLADCQVQMRRVEFVGPQVGGELINKGGFAMLYALLCILLYVTFRFRGKFAVGSIIALVHDVLITVGLFSIFQFEFSLPVLAAVLAVIGYSLNDTIVVYDRIRENFRKIRKGEAQSIMNTAINQTLPRTLLTSLTTLLVVLTLLLLGGEVIRGFSTALLIGVIVGTYSSVFIASTVVLELGISAEDMMPVQKEGIDNQP